MPAMFKRFADAVRMQFGEMSQEPLFTVDSDRDAIWATYLAAFPLGTNPTYRTNTEHDCSCCRHFIRDIGNVVAVQNGALVSVWDLNGLPAPYQKVADAMSAYIKGLAIRDVFLTPNAEHGPAITHGTVGDIVRRYDHFSATVPRKYVSADHVEKRGHARTTHAVLKRGLSELTAEAVATVVDLIQSNALYRGEEHQRAVLEFQQLQSRILGTQNTQTRDLLIWTMLDSPVARFRNTAIGTLVQDLSEGVDLERAVKSFETKVAPTNYKRPTALITKGMVEAAMKTIRDLGIEQALERRHARLSDVSVNSVLFVDNAVRGKMKGGLQGLLMDEVKPAPFAPKSAQDIGIDEFIQTVLPKTKSVGLYLDNTILSNFVSLTAPAHEDSGSLFKWGNDFGWSYDGNVADSIKDRVKKAGGQVEGVTLRVSLAWLNTDDLDLHIQEPNGGRIFFGVKQGRTGGVLDVDMNVHQVVRGAVENVRWTRVVPDGKYGIYVNNFRRRESVDVGFTIEIESSHGLETLSWPRGVPSKATVAVAELVVKNGAVQSMQIGQNIEHGAKSVEKWGLKTLDFARVDSIVLSPNHWDGAAIGNKHWFFVLDGCKNPLPTRGIYNEFLNASFEKHHKVFEVLGDKMKCPAADDQMSGVGFSSTRKDKVTVKAVGPSLNKLYTIAF